MASGASVQNHYLLYSSAKPSHFFYKLSMIHVLSNTVRYFWTVLEKKVIPTNFKRLELLNVKFIFNRREADCNADSLLIITLKLLGGMRCNLGLAYLKSMHTDLMHWTSIHSQSVIYTEQVFIRSLNLNKSPFSFIYILLDKYSFSVVHIPLNK